MSWTARSLIGGTAFLISLHLNPLSAQTAEQVCLNSGSAQTAAQVCTEILRSAGTSPEKRNSYLARRALAFIEIQKLREAEADVNAMLSLNTTRNAIAYQVRGRLREAQGQNTASLQDFDLAVSIATNKAPSLIARGSHFVRLGQLDRAEADINEAIRLSPNSTGALTAYARLSKSRGSDKAALAYYDQVLKINPSLAAIFVERGEVHFKNREMKRALEDFEKALSLEKGLGGAERGKSAVLAALQSEKTTQQPLTPAEAPQTTQTLPNVATPAGPPSPPPASAPPSPPASTQSPALPSTSPAPVNSQRTPEARQKAKAADDAIKAKKWPDALSILDELVKADSKDYESHYLRAVCLTSMGKMTDALGVHKMIFQSPAPPNIRAMSGNALGVEERLNLRFRSAVAIFTDATKLLPHPLLFGNLAASFYALGQYDDGIKAAERALQIDANHGWARGWMAMLLVASGDKDKAGRFIADAIAKEPRNALVLTARSMLHLSQGDADAADKDARAALSIQPDSREAKLALDLVFLNRNLKAKF